MSHVEITLRSPYEPATDDTALAHRRLPRNRNDLWAEVFVRALVEQGLRAVCIAPGSRSTPLVMACAAQPELRLFVHNDERGAAFFALGLARASGQATAVICTSGTAAANFLPAVIEAHMSETPLLVLTADRPPEAWDSGANQTIDQLKLYGDAVRWHTLAPLPEASPSHALLRAVQGIATRAWMYAHAPLPGPVHVNFPFRKPLEPTDVPEDYTPDSLPKQSAARFIPGTLRPSAEQIHTLHHAIRSTPRGLIVAGPRTPPRARAALFALARHAGYPILADALSNLRFGCAPHEADVLLTAYDTYLQQPPGAPELILTLGDSPTSTAALNFLAHSEAERIAISPHVRWRDEHFRTTLFLWSDPAELLNATLAHADDLQRDLAWLNAWQAAEDNARAAQPAIPEERYFARLLEVLPDNHWLFVGNSLPVRHLDRWARPTSRRLTVLANRGASGIDGTLSTALGMAAAGKPTTAVIGDLAFYHDMNGLLMLQRYPHLPFRLVIINNNGGRIFERLPIAQFFHDNHYAPNPALLFVSPHGMTFEHAARQFGLSYQAVEDELALTEALCDPRSPQVIEALVRP
ncbi:MAG: 2-succinyl-5-enolpyruvyl-6-hydroxy-3-cyclohexene-1-carboxylic-acid synthase [Thermoflexales bacterium]